MPTYIQLAVTNDLSSAQILNLKILVLTLNLVYYKKQIWKQRKKRFSAYDIEANYPYFNKNFIINILGFVFIF